VKGGKGLKHHEVVAEFTLRGLIRFVAGWLGRHLAGWKEQSALWSWRRNCSQDATDVS
jgi:hypothetical protein